MSAKPDNSENTPPATDSDLNQNNKSDSNKQEISHDEDTNTGEKVHKMDRNNLRIHPPDHSTHIPGPKSPIGGAPPLHPRSPTDPHHGDNGDHQLAPGRKLVAPSTPEQRRRAGHHTRSVETQAHALDHFHMIVVHGHKDPMSTLYPAAFRWEGTTFDNLEQAFMYQRAISNGREDLAKDIKRARNGGQAKVLGNKIMNSLSKEWLAQEPELMFKMMQGRLDQCPALRQRLLETKNSHLVFAIAKPGQDYFWSSGLDVENTAKCRGCYPGENAMGQQLMRLRNVLMEKEKPCDPIPVPVVTTAPVFL